jgi:glycosyltransferase involved in cell wall biosynthesis
MKICVDATPLLLRSVGVKTYLYHWLDHLIKESDEGTIVAFPSIKRLGALNHDASQLGFFSTAWRRALIAGANRKLPLATRLWMPKADLFHISSQFREPPSGLPLSATIYDFTVWLFPELHPEANIRADKHLAATVFQRAKGLIAISESTRQDAVRLLGVDPRRIQVIYPGVSESYFQAVPSGSSRFPRPYILFVGTIEPRKNVDLLLDAYSQLRASVRAEFDLVVAGPFGWKSAKTLARLQTPPPGVHYLGYVPESEMPALFAGATVLAYPSLYEGFGLPVAEAMACGVPVITSAVSSLPEVAGEGALLVDPRSVSNLVSALDRVLGDPSLRQALGKFGADRARKVFRWPVCAQQSLQFFQKVISNGN